MFDWNTKQLFVMLIAHYKTKRNVRHHDSQQYEVCIGIILCTSMIHTYIQIINQVVLWDKIIKRGDPATISASAIKPKYPFFDDGFGLL